MSWKLGVGVFALTLLSGCATNDHYYSNGVCVTCMNNPITGEPINYDPNETPQQVTNNSQGEVVGVQDLGSQSGSISIESKLDVDTAYARIKRGMGFRAPGDFEQGNTMSDWQMGDTAWKHQTTPGAYYDLGDYGRATINGNQYQLVQRVQIEKSGSGSRIHYSWAPADTRTFYDGSSMESTLRQRIESALQ